MRNQLVADLTEFREFRQVLHRDCSGSKVVGDDIGFVGIVQAAPEQHVRKIPPR